MTLLEQRFFSLLRSGLRGGAPDAALFPADTDWAALYDLSFRQTVVGLVTDGIHHLPAECLPPQEETLDPFLGDVMFTALFLFIYYLQLKRLDVFTPQEAIVPEDESSPKSEE